MFETKRHTNHGAPRSAFLPYPELVEPGCRGPHWKIEDSNEHDWLPTNGITDKGGRRIFVPLEPGGRGVSIHELAHVRWSPERLPRVRYPLIVLQAVEDARINLGLASIDLAVTLDRASLAHVAHLATGDAKEGRIACSIVRAVASLGTEAAPTMQAELEALPPRAAAFALACVSIVESRLTRAAQRVGTPVAPFRVARQVARDLARDMARHDLLADDLEVPGVGCCGVVKEIRARESDRRSGRDKRRAFERFLARGRGRAKGVAVGRMRVARPPLTVRQPKVLRAGLSGRRCAMEGTQITRPDRLVLDRAIFSRAGRGGSGTVLVDTSGSMSLSVAQVEQIVRAAGGTAMVAIYSGRGDVGELRIVASGDRRATTDQFERFGTGNIVDLPALEWLAKMPEPRLWLSDGCVTGVGDQGCEKLLETCRELTRRARITRYDGADDAIEALGGGAIGRFG